MRVLHVINDMRVGGAEVMLRHLAPRLREAGVEVEVAVLASSASFLQDELIQSGVPLRVAPANLGFYSPQQLRWLAQKMQHFDIAHIHLFPAQLWAAAGARHIPERCRPHLITTEHNTHNRRRKPLLRPLDQWLYGRYNAVVAVSEPVAQSLAHWVPATRAKTTVIPTAVDVERFAGAAAADKTAILGVTPDTLVLLCVGRLEPQKDQATLLQAIPLLPAHVHVVLVGDGPLRAALETLAQSLGVEKQVHFLGRRSDVPALLKMADVYVQPSRWEGWSVAVLEVMASGQTPIVAADAPGLAEAVAGCGLLFPIGDAGALATHVQTLLADGALRGTLIEKGRARASTFRIEECIARHIALYETLLAT